VDGDVGDGGLSLCDTLRKFKNWVRNTQSHGILEMKALLELNCLIIFVKRAKMKLLYVLKIVTSLRYKQRFSSQKLAKTMKTYFTKQVIT
jgi:hypothetical protein